MIVTASWGFVVDLRVFAVMGKHRLDARDGDAWGGPSLVSDPPRPARLAEPDGEATVPMPAVLEEPSTFGEISPSR
jgi:hypothetical protein